MHKEAKWEWGPKEQESFNAIKDAICKRLVLAHPNPEKPYFLETDASGAAMGAVLSQRQEDGRLHPIAYMSQSFNGAEHNYDTHDKELLAIIKSLEFWHIFLESTKDPITVFTDHCNLEYWQDVVNSTKTLEFIPNFLDFFRRLYAPVSDHVTPALTLAELPI
jgi:hypothetical protein